MNVAVILAGGTGNRLGAKIPKQYIEINGKPIIVYTLEKFEQSSEIDAIEVVCAEEYIDFIWTLCKKFGLEKVKWVVSGGATSNASASNGVYALEDICCDEDIFLLHMSVSPMISQETISNAIRTAKEKGNAFAAQPCLFCMCKKTTAEWSDEHAYKEDYVQLNMPWTWKYGEVKSLYREANQLGLGNNERSYAASLMADLHRKVYFFNDNPENRLKVTTPEDLELFKAYLLLEKQKKQEL